MALLKIVPIFALVLFVLAAVFMFRGETALGAALIALGMSQVAVIAALSAKMKKDTEEAEV